jgi:choline/glycine/proline betaine transport protein
MMTSGGDPNPPLWSRLFWAVMEGAIAFALLFTGDPATAFTALQTMAILVAAPATVVIIAIMISTLKAAHAHHQEILRLERATLTRELQLEIAEGLVSSGVLEGRPRTLPKLTDVHRGGVFAPHRHQREDGDT